MQCKARQRFATPREDRIEKAGPRARDSCREKKAKKIGCNARICIGHFNIRCTECAMCYASSMDLDLGQGSYILRSSPGGQGQPASWPNKGSHRPACPTSSSSTPRVPGNTNRHDTCTWSSTRTAAAAMERSHCKCARSGKTAPKSCPDTRPPP